MFERMAPVIRARRGGRAAPRQRHGIRPVERRLHARERAHASPRGRHGACQQRSTEQSIRRREEFRSRRVRSHRLERSMPRRESTPYGTCRRPHRVAMPRFATNCWKFVQGCRRRPGTAPFKPRTRYAAMQQNGV